MIKVNVYIYINKDDIFKRNKLIIYVIPRNFLPNISLKDLFFIHAMSMEIQIIISCYYRQIAAPTNPQNFFIIIHTPKVLCIFLLQYHAMQNKYSQFPSF